jgi:hypothetical protein
MSGKNQDDEFDVSTDVKDTKLFGNSKTNYNHNLL